MTQQEQLQILINGYVFAGSDSVLAELLGYGKDSRSTIGRVKKGGASPEKVAELLEKLCKVTYLSEEEVMTAAECVACGRDLYRELQAVYGVGGNWHDEAFEALAREDYAAISSRFERELSPHFNEMKLQTPELYFGMLAYCYILCKGMTPYTSGGAKKLPAQMQALNDMLFSFFPVNSRARQAAEKIIACELADERLTLLKLIFSIRAIFGNYIDAGYFEICMREQGHLFDVGEDSFWFVPGSTMGSGCELWYFSVVPTKSPLHGSYIAMRLRATAGETLSFDLAESYGLMFLVANDEDATKVLQTYDIPTGNLAYSSYDYNPATRRLQLLFDKEFPNVFSLPTELQCVNYHNPQGAEERMWKNIIEKQLVDRLRELLMKAVNSSGESDFEYLDEYEIANVVIDRKNITVTVEYAGSSLSYTLPLDAYPFLEKLTPAEYVGVARSKSTGEFYICWNNMGQYIPVKEFKVQR